VSATLDDTIFASGQRCARADSPLDKRRLLSQCTPGPFGRSVHPFLLPLTIEPVPRTRALFVPRVLVGALLPAVAAVGAACGGSDASNGGSAKTAAAKVGCASADTTPVSLAVKDYITTASPGPQRYLTAAGTDSALPPDGLKVIQDRGPTYFYNADPAAGKKLRDKLASAGPYTTMLVIFRGKSETDGGKTVAVKLAGLYVGGEHEGQKSPLKTYSVKCDSTTWKLAGSAADSVH